MDTKDLKIPDDKSTATDFLITASVAILGAATGAKVADEVIGGRGLPSALAQLGGAILGAVGGKALSDAIRANGGETR